MRNALTAAVCLAGLVVFFLRGEAAVRATSPTFDEVVHLAGGYSYWRTGDFRINCETPPLMKLVWAVPLVLGERPPFAPDREQWEKNDIWRMGDAFLYESPVRADSMLLPARRVNLAFGAMLVVLVGWWALRLWGRTAAAAAWALAALDPNLLGQSAVLSTDVGLALFCTAAAYALWEYAANPARGWFLFAGVCFGLALATKFSAGAAVVGCALGAVALVLAGGSITLPGGAPAADRRGRLKALFPVFVRLGLIAIVSILPTYFVIQSLDWAKGLRLQLGRNEFEPPKYFLNGEVSTRGWWWYFPETLALKTPAGTLALAAISVVGLAVGKRLSRRDVAFLVVPAAVYFLAMAAARLNIGVRVVLPAYPLLWLLAARVAAFESGPWTRALSGLVLAVGILAPPLLDPAPSGKRSLSYFNGLVAGREDGHRFLGDSNLDWGQGLKELAAEVRARGEPVIYLSYAGTARPEAYGIRYERLPSWGQFRDPPADRVDPVGPTLVAVSVSNLQGTYLRDPDTFRWLLDRAPVSRTDDSIWLFDVTGDADAIARLRAAADRPGS
jgi:Dolichyl-phosphate-mannose-protein mannosyltransferase